MIKYLSTEDFRTEVFDFTTHNEWVFEKSKPAILVFFAEWCGPCHMYAPILEEIAENFKETVDIYKLDIDQAPEIPALFGVRSVPATFFLKPGAEPQLNLGFISIEGMEKAIQELLLN